MLSSGRGDRLLELDIVCLLVLPVCIDEELSCMYIG